MRVGDLVVLNPETVTSHNYDEYVYEVLSKARLDTGWYYIVKNISRPTNSVKSFKEDWLKLYKAKATAPQSPFWVGKFAKSNIA